MDETRFHQLLYRPGTLLDIGAHDGLLTRPFAALPGSRVLAFEPLPVAFARLQAACAGLPNVELHQAALGDQVGEATLTMPLVDGVAQEQWASTAKGYAGFGAQVTEARFTVPLRKLDEFGLHDVTGVKLDAEGAEYEMLRGGRETLLRCRPVLTLEIEERHRPGATHAVPAYLDALGYDAWFELQDVWHPIRDFDRGSMQVASSDPSVFGASDPYVFIFYFLPREAAPEMLASLQRGVA